jgi:hypothetical protein
MLAMRTGVSVQMNQAEFNKLSSDEKSYIMSVPDRFVPGTIKITNKNPEFNVIFFKGKVSSDNMVVISSLNFDQEEFETKDGFFLISKDENVVNGIRALINKY